MDMKFRKALSDLTISPRRTFLVVFALVLGIWGVGTVYVSNYILTRDLNTNYQRTRPAQLILHSDAFTDQDVRMVRENPEVETAELRDFTMERIEIYPDVWIPLWIFGVEDFRNPSMAYIFPQEGKIIPDSGMLLMERDGKLVSGIRVGDSPRIRVGSAMLNIRISGICFDPAQAPATQDAFIYTYTDKATYSRITGLPCNQRLIVRLKNVHSAEEVKTIAGRLEKSFSERGITIRSVEIPRFNQHPHQWQLNTLLFLVGAIGLLALIMGSVLVSQLMRSILAGQLRQIGIMKALGASQIQVFQIYILMLLLMGLSAGLIGVPLSILTGKAFSYFVAGKLNFDILTTTLPFGVYAGLFVTSLLLPILLSVSLLLKGTGIPVLGALSDYGIPQNINTRKSRLSERLPFSSAFIMAMRNSIRNSRRLTVTILTMALGVAIFSTGFNVRQSLWNLLSGLKQEMQYDVQVVLCGPVAAADAMAPFKSLDNVKEVETWLGGRGELQSKVIASDKGSGIIALPRDTRLLKMRIKRGRWLKSSSDFEVVLNQQAMDIYKNPALGSTFSLTVQNKTVNARLVGITEQFERAKIYVDQQQYDAVFNPAHAINSLVFVARDNDYRKVVQLKKDIERAIAGSGLNVLYVMSQAERVKIIYDHLNIILSTIVMLSFLVLIVSAIGMASATGINIWERTREIGVMRAVGATPRAIYAIFVYEGMIISVMSILIGLLLAYPLSQLAAVFFGRLMLGNAAILDYAFSITGFVITLSVTLLFGWMASRFPAKSAIRIPTHKALSYE
jgi:putative ABC transport system permease protein